MKRILLNTKISKIYILGSILISFLLLASYFSYAMFTVSKEKSNAISIVTGNLTYELLIDGVESNTLTVAANSKQDFTITLNNPNTRIARFNFYYLGDLPDGISAGYIVADGFNIPPEETGINLETAGSVGASSLYKIRVANNSGSDVNITLGVQVGLDYNDLTLPSNGHLFEKIVYPTVAEALLADSANNINTTDPNQIFITGTDPNNYIWYSGKLWRAVSIDPVDNSVKLVTQWNISAIPYNASVSTAFEGSYMESWLNDTSADGFLGNLREPEKFIKMDSVWNATETTATTKPSETTMVTDPVGLLNIYEYTMSYSGTTYSNGYLNNGLWWWSITPYSSSSLHRVTDDGYVNYYSPSNAHGVRPSVNLKSNVKIVSGDGTIDNPYRLNGDNDTDFSGTLLSTRYSGEYIRFGTGENNLYRIVSHENGKGTKITSAELLKSGASFIESAFGSNPIFSSTNTIGIFLNNDYLDTENGYLTSEDIAMIEDETTWYLGIVGDGESYKLAKYTNTTDNILTSSVTIAKIGLLRLGELMSGQFDRYGNNTNYWTLTPYSLSNVRRVTDDGSVDYNNPPTNVYGVRPSLNLKQNVIISGGDGTFQNPFTLALA